MNEDTHRYTCLEAPPELVTFGLTHVVCRTDNRERFDAAFGSSAAASMFCDQLNGFAKQDEPSLLGQDDAEREIEEAKRTLKEREAEQVVAVQQATSVTKS